MAIFLFWSVLLVTMAYVWTAPTSPMPPVQRPAYVIKFVALFPDMGPLAYCDYNSSPKTRNKCDFRVHFDVLFPDDPNSAPYGKLEYNLPDNSDYYVADPVNTWPTPIPTPSYPGEWNTLSSDQYEHVLSNDRQGMPIQFRVTIFDRDDVGTNDMIAQQTYNYTLNDVLRLREKIQSNDVACTSAAGCHALRLKYVFYMLDAAQ